MVESYVIEIYRRDPDDHRRFNGTVERVGDGKQQAFGTMDGLWDFLAAEVIAAKPGRPGDGLSGPDIPKR